MTDTAVIAAGVAADLFFQSAPLKDGLHLVGQAQAQAHTEAMTAGAGGGLGM